ncbi:hypothetical protein Nepgr_014462 [Nepenthes gracilis]|uniref:BHLH domain-containing protein n=1 Tax=Nepenthes gracilis TaxID=150966 RepID=A0AAD3SL85_NEPGR|nr:hypothetical protein Nepgr_014462 [Nepenthes gracilis]
MKPNKDEAVHVSPAARSQIIGFLPMKVPMKNNLLPGRSRRTAHLIWRKLMNSNSEFPNSFERVSESSSGSPTILSGSASLVLDSEKGELVKAPVAFGRDRAAAAAAAKTAAALKNHSEAEKRRRERINGHLATLRSLVPGASQMDKASLLAKVINHLKGLKKNAAEAMGGLIIPLDADEVIIEELSDVSDRTGFSIKASICCDYRCEILSDLRQALDSLHLRMVSAEIATLNGRMKNIFVMTAFEEAAAIEDIEDYKYLSSSCVHQALKSVLEKFSSSKQLSSRDLLSNKRRRVSFLNYSSSY